MRAFALVISLLSVLSGGCAHLSGPDPGKIGLYFAPGEENLERVIHEVEARNATLERKPMWIAASHRDLLIGNLGETPESDDAGYRKYLDDGALYIIVHPAYSVFFPGDRPSRITDAPVDAFLKEWAYTKDMRFLQEQERSLRDFIEITSTRKRLVLLILPGDYQDYAGYAYRNFPDEYARYINSVANESPSVLYLFSEKPTKGNLSKSSKERLARFIRAVNPQAIVIGGAYLGRCIEDFYADVAGIVDEVTVTIAGEISAISPDDLDDVDLSEFLKDGRLDIQALRRFVAARYGTPRSWTGHPRDYRGHPDAGKRQG